MNSYLALKTHITKGGDKLNDVLCRLSAFAAGGEITLEEKAELEALARGKASVENEVNLIPVVLDLVRRVRALEAVQGTETPPATEPDEYVEGKWYYGGDRVKFNGKTYKCVAPEGAVCVWSPEGYPAYWQLEG